MPLQSVIKRSGEKVPYDRNKILNAITGANRDATTIKDMLTPSAIQSVVLSVEQIIKDSEFVDVESIQDLVEKQLMEHDYYDVAKQYIIYRNNHAQRRKARKDLLSTYNDIFFVEADKVDSKRENANINGNSPMGMMLKIGTETCKYYVDHYVLPHEFVEANKENWIHSFLIFGYNEENRLFNIFDSTQRHDEGGYNLYKFVVEEDTLSRMPSSA